LVGRGNVTFLHIAYTKSSKNVGKLAFVYGRFKNPFFSVANTDFEGGENDHCYGDCIFWSSMRNPAIAKKCPGNYYFSKNNFGTSPHPTGRKLKAEPHVFMCSIAA
jgi:hypothetical protein